jgi:hypothetical protein
MSKTKVDLHDMYYQDQKQGIVEVFVTLRLPINVHLKKSETLSDNHCKRCGEWNEFGDSVCSECGEIIK